MCLISAVFVPLKGTLPLTSSGQCKAFLSRSQIFKYTVNTLLPLGINVILVGLLKEIIPIQWK